jgi:hypothetical protein
MLPHPLSAAAAVLLTLGAGRPPQGPDLPQRTRDYFAALDKRDVATVERVLCDRAVRINIRGVITARDQMLASLRRPSQGPPVQREWGQMTVHDLGTTKLVTADLILRGPQNAGETENLVSIHWGTGANGPCVLVEQRVPAGQAAEAAFWNEVFMVSGGFNSQPNAWLVEVASKLKPGRALDVAMGQGRNAIWLARQGWDVTGYDIATDGLRIARETAAAGGVKINTVLSSTEKFDFGKEQWDLIAIIYGGGRNDEIPRAAKGLKRGGHLVVEGFLATGADTPGGVTFDRQFLHDKCREAGLDVVRYEEPTNAQTDYGGGRPVRLLARKP